MNKNKLETTTTWAVVICGLVNVSRLNEDDKINKTATKHNVKQCSSDWNRGVKNNAMVASDAMD